MHRITDIPNHTKSYQRRPVNRVFQQPARRSSPLHQQRLEGGERALEIDARKVAHDEHQS